jgi:hydrogenase-4 component B
MSAVLAAALLLLLVCTGAAALWPRVASVGGALASTALVVVGISAALGDPATLDLGSWLGFGQSGLLVDGMAGVFLALAGVTAAATSCACAELAPGRWLCALNGALTFAVAVVICADSGFEFLLAWELLTVVIYLIAAADRDRAGALTDAYLTAGLAKVGGAALLAAVGLLFAETGTFSLSAWASADLGPGLTSVLFALFLIAFATKLGIVPLQGGLPAGYGAAPRIGAASLSVALAAGFYGLWRFAFDILGPLPVWCGDLLLIVGSISAVAGIVYAITQDDVRRFLGFSTVEHTGIAAIGLGVALLGQSAGNEKLAAAGLLAATLHVVAHGLAKNLALIVMARVEAATGRRTLDPLGGLGSTQPIEAAGFGAAALTLAAIPPLGGFVSEWFTFEALLQGFRMPALLSQLLCALAAAMLALSAGFGLLAFAKLFGFAFLGPRRERLARNLLPAPALSVIGLGGLVVVLGALAPWEIHLLGQGLSGALGFDPSGDAISHPLVLGPVFADFSVLAPTWLAIVLPSFALAAAAIAWAIRRPSSRRTDVWVTGSGADLAAVQYRPSSYSNPIRVVLRGPLGYFSRIEPADDGRGGSRLATGVVLATDQLIYRPLSRIALAAATQVRRLQSGSLSAYLLYILVVLIVALALIPTLN